MTEISPSAETAPLEGWHLDKRIPIAFVLALVLQTSAALVWAGGVRERMAHVESDARRVQDISERLARLESQMTDARDTLTRIEFKLDRGAPPADPKHRQ